MQRKDLEVVTRSLSLVESQKLNDLLTTRNNNMQAELIARQIETNDINNNIQVVDDAFMMIMNYELYDQATKYKQKEIEDLNQKERINKEKVMERRMQEKHNVIKKLKEENAQKAEQLGEARKDADQLAEVCSGRLEDLSLYRNNLDVGNYLLEEMKKERTEILEKKLKELEELKRIKKEMSEGSINYKREIQENNNKLNTLDSELRQSIERNENSEKLLSRIILMLKRMVPVLLPEEKNVNVTVQNMERYVTLCGLSLEQKARILSFRNRGLLVENVNEDPNAPGTAKAIETEASLEDKLIEKEEEKFLKKAREKIKDKKIPPNGIYFA